MERIEKRENKIRDLKRELILDAALEQFSKKGILDTTLEEIAAEAGFSKGSLYNYYANKEEIIFCLMTRELEILLERFSSSPDYALSPQLPFEENLRRYFYLSFTTVKKHFRFMISANIPEYFGYLCKDKDQFEKLSNFKEESVREVVMRFLTWAREKNELSSNFDDDFIYNTVTGICVGAMQHWMRKGEIDDSEVEGASKVFVDLLLNGLRRR